ncbi:MAG: hypothetical protein Q8L49_01925 [Burkholderiaceae bacterium]|nr:hypothetical protein [Burkholderiaceae bacterium]
MQRRTLLKLGLASGAALVLAGGGAALFYERAWRAGRLTETGRSVFAAVARAVLDGSLPADSGPQQAALASHLERMDGTLRAMPPATQREVGDLLALLAMPPGRLALAGLATDWPQADVAQIQAALQSMRGSRLALRQQAYHALRDLTHAAYFADSATWVQLGYPGPLRFD